ncbi:thiol-activated cytolysin family protein [Chitinophaga sp. 22321]|uniref:Thiol-activated cytolysin family protein n=1 Tax=Chitinophaga hostae TaxID=2831022 RepID=A0ABS5J250_9BACT|nr:thiol-activated cytolysin family protein [Chitinophaga hostae]MBS0029296.1 thiol-activated cytolysin family protein [Chitinophaga hostae]
MKRKHLLFAAIFAFAVSSCRKETQPVVEEQPPITSFKDLKKIPDAIVDIKAGNVNLEDILKNNKKSVLEFLRDSAWANGTGKTMIFSSDEQLAPENQLRLVYPGSLLQAGGIAALKYVPIAKYQGKVKPITVSVSAPGKYISGVINKPSISATREFIGSVFGNGPVGNELVGFQFDMNQFTYYEELKLTIGANVSIGSLFSVGASFGKEKVEKTTGLVAKFIQKNFTLDMDLPDDGNLLDSTVNPADLGPLSPVYVSSITYGRMGIIKVESNYSYEELKLAFNIAFKISTVGGGVQVDATTKKIIDESSIQVRTVGGEGDEVTKTIVGYEEFRKYIESGGNYSSKAPGFPLYFTLSHLSDHSVFSTIFNVNVPNK